MLKVNFTWGDSLTWNVGDIMPVYYISQIRAIESISAEGNELDLIKEKFRANHYSHSESNHFTIPMPANQSTVYWYGDIAKTIIANLM